MDGEFRGSGKVEFYPELDRHLVFLIIYSNGEGEQLTYKYYDRSEDQELGLAEANGFVANGIVGTVDEPHPLTLSGTTSTEDDGALGIAFSVGPNPFANDLHIEFVLDKPSMCQVTVTDALGKEVAGWSLEGSTGVNELTWSPDQSTPTGTYFVTLSTDDRSIVEKVMFIR